MKQSGTLHGRAAASQPSRLQFKKFFFFQFDVRVVRAIDPIARARLQDEFKQILKRVKKTVVLVTHDLDEAVRLGDRIAIMRSGKIVQYDTPDAILSHPADPFVADFVGTDRAIKQLSLFTVADALEAAPARNAAVTVQPGVNLRDALALMVSANSDELCVIDGSGSAVGRLTRDAVFSI
jgi:osmoprotectant transport system ATP-binding protein